ncbi:MAG: hypothetical protein ACI4UM_08985 [Succinivibrio sp.]
MKQFIVVPFGLNDTVVDLSEKREKCHDRRLECVVVKDQKFTIAGKRAIASRFSNGYDVPFESRINNSFEGINRIPVYYLWNQLTNHRDNSRKKYKVRLREINSDKTIDKYIDELLLEHIKALISDFDEKNNFGVDEEYEVLIPISNELSEYAQEYLIRSASVCGIKLSFIWKEVAALMMLIHERKGSVYLNEGKKIKVVYIGVDGIESCTFELAIDGEALVPVRRRPSVKRQQIPAIDSLIQHLHEVNSVKGKLYDSALSVWQIINTRHDVFDQYLQNSCSEVEKSVIYQNKIAELLDYELVSKNTKPDYTISQSYFTKKLSEDNNILPDIEFDINDFIFDKTDDSYDAILLCGGFISKNLQERILSEAELRNVTVFTSATDLITEGCKLYDYNLSHDLPTYMDVIPSLAIAYLDDTEYKWSYLIPKNTKIAGGREYRNEKPFKDLYLDKNERRLLVYLKVEDDDQEEDSGIRVQEKTFEKSSDEAIKLVLNLSIRAAQGLAKVYITDEQSFLPARGFLFDYSDMKKTELPPIKLPYPKESVFPNVYNEYNPILSEVADSLLEEVCNSTFDSDIVETLSNIYKKLTSKIKGMRPYNLDLYAGTNKTNQENLLKIIELSESLFKFESGKLQVVTDYKTYHLSNNDEGGLQKLLTYLSYLYNKTPKAVKKYLEYRLDNNARGLDAYRFFELYTRVFNNEQEVITKIFKWFNQLTRDNRNKFYIIKSLNWLLDYSPKAKFCLSKETASNIIQLSYDAFVEQKKKGNYKNKFAKATKLFLMSLKYRCKDRDFMLPGKEPLYLLKMKTDIYDIIDEGVKRIPQNNKSLLIRDYKEKIEDFINKKGDMSFIRRINENIGDKESD